MVADSYDFAGGDGEHFGTGLRKEVNALMRARPTISNHAEAGPVDRAEPPDILQTIESDLHSHQRIAERRFLKRP
jgi:hypothetical protein